MTTSAYSFGAFLGEIIIASEKYIGTRRDTLPHRGLDSLGDGVYDPILATAIDTCRLKHEHRICAKTSGSKNRN